MNRKKLRWVSGKKTPAKVYITRVFNYGTWREWQSMKNRFSSHEIKQAVKKPLPGQWTRRAKCFAEVLYSVRMPKWTLISYEI